MREQLHGITPPGPCEHLPGRVSRMEVLIGPSSREQYAERVRDGWRRFGFMTFRPACGSCRMCQSLRVPVGAFRPSKSQRRAWKANAARVEITIGAPAITVAKLDLFDRFHRARSESKGWPPPAEDGMDTFLSNPFHTEEWCYLDGDRLLGVGYVDVLPDGLSAIYFFHEPEARDRSLGTFNVLAIIEAARSRHLPYVYLGYYVEGCGSLEYKARFRPNQVLDPGSGWHPFVT
jgi:arginine-tRNA-protein transferase